MKVSYNWLKDYCDFDLPAYELAEKLSHAGLNVDTYEPRGEDWGLEVEVTTNRPDCLCHVGVAREIAAITGGVARRPELPPRLDGGDGLGEHASVEVRDAGLCPHYIARVITGVQVGPSPRWLQDRLAVCGLRSVNNIVDATNFVMLECGQPLHAFDLSRLGGRRIIVRAAAAGEVITLIDGTELELSGKECVIADQDQSVALAGVMGGSEAEIGDGTTDVLIESARFDSVNIRRTARRHGLTSDSSYRFERGVDPEITDWASRRVCRLIVELAGGTLVPGAAEVRSDTTEAPELTLRLGRLALVLGIEVPLDAVTRIFKGLGLDILEATCEQVSIRVPSWRADLRREIDLIEEIARIHGYANISETTDMPVRSVTPSLADVAARRTRRMLSGQGFFEVITYSIVPDNPLQRCQPWHEGAPLALRNPVTTERTRMRLTNMANLLSVKSFNQAHGTRCVDLYELGPVYLPRKGEPQPEEKLCLTALTDRENGLRVLKGVLANLANELGADADIEERPGATGPFRTDESLTLSLDASFLGCAGIVSDEVAGELDLHTRPALMEIDYRLLADRCRPDRPYRPVPTFPATARDLAVVVAEDVLWTDISRCVREAATETLESVEFLDVYRGDPVPEGRKSVAFSLTFRRQDKTITAAEAEEGRAAILAALQRELCAVLR